MDADKNGMYQWKGTFDKEYERKQYRIVKYVVYGFCLLLIIFGAVLCIAGGDFGMLPAFVIPAVFAAIITAIVCFVFERSGGGAVRNYVMTNDFIRMGYGRSAGYFTFSTAKHVIFTKTYIEPQMGIMGFRIYVPEADMPFVKQYVLSRLPLTCEVEDKSFFA